MPYYKEIKINCKLRFDINLTEINESVQLQLHKIFHEQLLLMINMKIQNNLHKHDIPQKLFYMK